MALVVRSAAFTDSAWGSTLGQENVRSQGQKQKVEGDPAEQNREMKEKRIRELWPFLSERLTADPECDNTGVSSPGGEPQPHLCLHSGEPADNFQLPQLQGSHYVPGQMELSGRYALGLWGVRGTLL